MAHALVVEDDVVVAEMHRSMLVALGYRVTVCDDGIAAMLALREHPDIQLALVDWYMQPLNGYAFAAAIRAEPRYADLILILASAEDRPEKLAEAQAAGLDACLTKPLAPQTLSATLERCKTRGPRGPDHHDEVSPERIGSYEVVAPIGRGASSRVYRGVHRSTRHEAAIKVLDVTAEQRRRRERFRLEAALMQRLNDHPHVLPIHEVGSLGRQDYLAMGFAHGGDATRRLSERGGRLDEAEANRVILACAKALSAIHGIGAAHRDIKPTNIFYHADDRVCLGDFGLALDVTGTQRLTVEGMAVGTPSYMAPEQIQGQRDLAQRSDLFGLGATWYHLLTGRPPFDRGTAYATFTAVQQEPIPDPRAAGIDLTPGTHGLLMSCLEKDPAHRPESAGWLAHELAALAAIARP